MFRVTDTELRPLESKDLRQVLMWRNSERIRNSMFTSHIISWEEHIAWFNKLQYRTDQAVLLFLYQREPIGVINFTELDKDKCCCEWGFYIGPEDAASGSGTAMGLLGLDYAFRQLGMKRICGQCLITNAASARYHEKLGFIFKNQTELQPDYQEDIFTVKQFQLEKEVWAARRLILYLQVFSDYEEVMKQL